ncbi:MAG TPA: adenylate/guanylate cyclase domain-containing protein [Gaiellaceae bacterium]|nr:adenylate/guanylate cyclase domain-containing protein [Gaiellaceae bacterium]
MAELPTGTVTLLFTDIEGSTRLLRRVGDAYAGLLSQHRSLLEQAFLAHRGVIVDREGDAFFVAFGSAKDAVAAAADAQRALVSHDWVDENEIRVRMGLHTGEPRVVEGRYVGLDVHEAARVMAVAHGGQVVVSESTRVLLEDDTSLRDLGEHRLKDIARPQRLYQLELEGLPSEFPPLASLDNRPTNLPAQPNAFIGRERELAETRDLLEREDVRLLTLIGPGGTGKTRLALQLAGGVLDRFRNGVFFVSLTPIRDWELVVPTILRTLGSREQPGETSLETLTEYLQEKELLLLLDNFEHVLAASPAVAGLLGSAPDLQLLVTSRIPLRLQAEHAHRVPQLAVPDLRRPAVAEEVVDFESVRLFVERARAAAVDFSVDDVNAEAVAEIVVRLDGLPLAIELAAPRVRTLTPPALLRRLDQRLPLLTGGAQDADARQRTLRGTIAWSHDLLLASEKTLFERLAVFVGGCRLEAAEAVCDFDGTFGHDLLDGLDSLVQKSLLRQRQDSDGEPRFWMLETIREFGLELLEAAGELEAACERHAAWTAGQAERLDADSRTGDHPAFLAQVDEEYPNLREAIAFARKVRDGELLLRLATALWGFWSSRVYGAEGRRALEDALELSGRRPARTLLGLCTLRMLSGSSEQLREAAQEALEASQQLDDDYSLAQAWNLVGRVEGTVMGSLATAEEAWRQALSFARRGNYRAELAESISWLMVSAVFGPLPVEDGIARCHEFLALEGEDPTIRATCSVERAVLEAMRGDLPSARELLAEGRKTIEESGLTLWAALNAQETYLVEQLAGTPGAAAAALRESFATLDGGGERAYLSTIAGFLAHALYADGEHAEAERFSRESERAASSDDVLSQVLWRTVRAKILARRDELETAETLAREAVGIAEPTDLLGTRADALFDFAEVLAVAGRRDESLTAVGRASELYERKGNLTALARARARTAELAAT